MPYDELSRFEVADVTVSFAIDRATGRVGLELCPTELLPRRVPRRPGLAGLPYIDAIPGAGNPPASAIDPLVHLKLVGDAYPGAFAQGRTMRCAPSNDRFRYQGQKVSREGGRTAVLTTLASAEGLTLEHRLSWHDGEPAMEVMSSFTNGSDRPVRLEFLTSFSLGGITPFHEADAPGRLRAHRFRSVWSAEGRLQSETLEHLHLERSWSGAGLFSERFGQVGSMPVRGWFPFAAVEDTDAGVLWGAQLAWAGSWQMELSRQHDEVCISGGLADREFGQWLKTVAPGETLVTPPAVLACAKGGLDELCERLTAPQQRAAERQPEVERDLPIIFNEWCTTWGDPSHERLLGIARSLKDSGARYLVIDAGWYKTDTGNWDNGHGDWIPSARLFPDGLAATAGAIRDMGLIPGLWFEMETVGERSTSFTMADRLLHRDGIPITVRSRRFWNLNDAGAVDFLTTRVIDLLERCGFGYLKVDYNETIGIGAEDGGAESLGEGLRLQIEGVYRFFDRIRARLPHLVIENCSSGGHRLEPSMLGRTAMSSFSDAHELVEIPLIAANLHRLMLPRQSQIWAVLHASDSDQRLAYSLAATFLGRMCLSGEIDRLSPAQHALVRRATRLYPRCVPIIKHGSTRRVGTLGESWRHPEGWQAVIRRSGEQVLVVAHAFGNSPRRPVVTLPDVAGRRWRLVDQFGTAESTLSGNELESALDRDFSGCVTLLSLD